jgi:hypothetical protein
MFANAFKSGEEVAVTSATGHTVELATINHAGPVFVQLTDGRMYATSDGVGLNTNGYIVAATDEHRAALADRPPA